MIYLRRLPRVIALFTCATGLILVGATIFLVNIVWTGFTSETWNEALDRADPTRGLR
jgi:hypothetical protein